MKTFLLLLFAVASFQIIVAQNVNFGVKGGANYSSYIENYDGPFNYKYKLGFQFGGFAKIALSNKLFLQPELLYSMQGARFDLGMLFLPEIGPGHDEPLFSDGNMEGSYNESTIILPVMLKYYLNDKFNIEIGPQIDYLFNIKTSFDTDTTNDSNSIGTSDSVSEFNFGANLGLGYDFNGNMGVGIRYNYGFNRFNSDFAKKIGSKRNNSVFSLSLAYSFN